MKNCLNRADSCVKKMNVTDVALLKFCLCALGIVIGMVIPSDKRKGVAIGACSVFAATYVPLMLKFSKTMTEKE